MEIAKENRMMCVAFSLLSAGRYLGPARTLHQVLEIAIRSVCNSGYEGLREVYMCGFTADKFFTLIEVAFQLGLMRE